MIQFGNLRRSAPDFGALVEETYMESPRIDDIARRLFEGLPESARILRRDIESNFRAVLQASLGKLDLTTRSEFDVQARVLERTRARIDELEQRIAMLEQRLMELEPKTP
jgi:ubiquinone biosynthesis accessory factor UbiK